MLSIIKLIVDILEDVNDKITSFLQSIENDYDYQILIDIRNCKENVDILIENYCKESEVDDWGKKRLFQYQKARKQRTKIRIVRRIFLYIYYSIFMLLLVLLLLHSELSTIYNAEIFKNIDLNLFTIWSVIIILLEIMMKDILEKLVVIFLEKKIGTNLDWY